MLTVKTFKTAVTVAVPIHKMDPERFIEIKHDNYKLDLNLVVVLILLVKTLSLSMEKMEKKFSNNMLEKNT